MKLTHREQTLSKDAASNRFGGYGSYLLGILMLIYAMTLVDRLVLSILLQDIKLELHLSDTQLGLLTGLAFAVFYAGVGIPLARWADRGDRVTLLAVMTAVFSGAVALGSLVVNFVQLLLVRISAGAGESGCQPTALSLISDHFSREHRPRAVARYLLGGPLALFCGYFIAGWLNELFGWRSTLVIMAAPGLLLAALVATTLREPRRHAAMTAGDAPATSDLPYQPPFRAVLAELARNDAYKHLLMAYALQSFFVVGVVQWQPAFFIRSFGLSSAELGTWLAFCYGTTGVVGTWIGGELATRFAAGDERRQLLWIAVIFAALALVKPTVYLMPSYPFAFGMLGLASFLAGLTNGPIYSAFQTVVPSETRATATAILMFSANLIGSGLGPLAAGILSDALTPAYGPEALRYVLVFMGPGYVWAGLHVWLAARRLRTHPVGDAASPTASAAGAACNPERARVLNCD